MSGEIVVPETPNWLQELEDKRERRLKVKLGHEAGAGAPCLKCGDDCPGLDLHFWRKCCKICKCSKEEHEVQDDDIYGWAQFQLLGSKPNKIKTKILLPGKKDEIDLDWVPKGHNDTVEKYLKTLPPEQLPVKGSQAAQDRKQLLQKQIPIHDIDPTLCHELTEEELQKMNEYIAHVKQSSAGVGQIVSLSNIIKGKLHMLNPAEVSILASRFAKGIPISEIVKLQSQNRTVPLSHNLEKLSLKNKNLPQFYPTIPNQSEDISNPVSFTKVHDKDFPLYNNEINQQVSNAQFSTGLSPKPTKNNTAVTNTYTDEKYEPNSNFNPKNRPSNFIHTNSQNAPGIPRENPLEYNLGNSAFVPYQKISLPKSEDTYWEDNYSSNPNYAKNLPGQIKTQNADTFSMNKPHFQNKENNGQIYENLQDLKSSPANLPNYIAGKYNTYTENQSPTRIVKNVKDLAFSTYDANKIDPKEIPVQDTGFRFGKYREPGSYNDKILKNSSGFRPIEAGSYENIPNSQLYDQENQEVHPINPIYSSRSLGSKPGDVNNPSNNNSYPKLQTGDTENARFETSNPHNYLNNSTTVKPMGVGSHSSQINPNVPVRPYSGLKTENVAAHNAQFESTNPNFFTLKTGDLQMYPRLSGFKSNDISFPNLNSKNPYTNNEQLGQIKIFNPLISNPSNATEMLHGDVGGNKYGNTPTDSDPNKNTQYEHTNNPIKSGKKLSELLPSELRVGEDFLNPSQVRIGPIQDINYPDIKTATHEVGDFFEEYSPESIKEILNNVILPDCHYCKKPFEENEFAVSIDRANVLFHAGCFKCAGCNQILADNVYFFNKETDNVYCLRDYAKIRGFPRCKACDELIFTKEYCLAENSTFHLKHFCCTECDMPLAGQDYLLEDEMPYCLPCFEQNKASKCNTCGNLIKPDEIGCNLNGIHFHAVDACFACKVCKTPLMGKKLLLRNDKLYCSHDCYGTDQ